MLIIFLFFFTLANSLGAMNAPAQAVENLDPDPKKLCAALMQDGPWDAQTLEKFKDLDSCKNAAAIKEELLQNQLDVLFDLNCSDSKFEEEKFHETQTHPWKRPSPPVLNFPEGTVYKFHNTPKSVSLNNDGSTIAVADMANRTFYKNRTLNNFTFFNTSGGSIKSVKVFEHGNLFSIAQNEQYTVVNASELKDQIIRNTTRNFVTKKSIFSSKGNWALKKDYNNRILLVNMADGSNWPVTIETPQSFVIDEQGKQGLIGTTSDLWFVRRNDKEEFVFEKIEINGSLPDVTDVDMTLDGKFGLAVNHLGFGRISLSLANTSLIYVKKPGTTIGRISNDGQIIVTGHTNGAVAINKVMENQICQMTKLNYLCGTLITCLAVSGDNKTLAAGSNKGLFTVSCKDLWKEFEKLTPAQLVAFFRTYNAPHEYDSKEIKSKIETNKKLMSKLLQSGKLKEEDFEDMMCPVCKENICDMKTPCIHGFCTSCIENWKNTGNNSCPACRSPLTP